MGLGKHIRLNRLFSHPSGNLCSIAVDHFMIYNLGLPPGLRSLKDTLAAVAAGEPDAVTMHKGIASALWEPYAGRLPLILQSTGSRPDDSAIEQYATVEDAVRLGADALAVVAFVRGASEGHYLRVVADCVREGQRWELPVICHVYPRGTDMNIIYTPEDIAWAVHCIVEVGADVVKAPYCGDAESHRQIAADCPVPLVAAGGPKAATLRDALDMMATLIDCGVRGGTVGRNIWGDPDITGAVRAYKAVIHDGKTADEALREMNTLELT